MKTISEIDQISYISGVELFQKELPVADELEIPEARIDHAVCYIDIPSKHEHITNNEMVENSLILSQTVEERDYAISSIPGIFFFGGVDMKGFYNDTYLFIR